MTKIWYDFHTRNDTLDLGVLLLKIHSCRFKEKKIVSEALLDRVHLGSQDHARLKKYNNNH